MFRATFVDFDKVLGFDITETITEVYPQEIADLKKQRELAREEKNWEESDKIRDEIEKLGYIVEDAKDGMKVFKK